MLLYFASKLLCNYIFIGRCSNFIRLECKFVADGLREINRWLHWCYKVFTVTLRSCYAGVI